MSSHRRRNALTGDWVLVTEGRLDRPWREPGCYLCPGSRRAAGHVNPDYTGTYVFENDFPGFTAEGSETGICRVICFSPTHETTLAEMSQAEIRAVVETWVEQTSELGGREDITHIQIFENKGELMGCSNPHPHGQIWAQRSIPNEVLKELREQSAYYGLHNRTLLSDYLEQERKSGERIVCANESFTALVPYWAVWPFETLVIPHRALPHITQFTADERAAFADIIRRVTVRYDNLFQTSFPYSAGIHQAPFAGALHPDLHLHMHFYPPLLRSASIRKFMVGYEMLAEPQRDFPPEQAAARLREQSEVHYKHA